MIQVAPLRYGVIFKKVFSQLHIFKAFVRDITGIDLQIERVETEKSFFPPIGRVQSRFDLFAEDTQNRIIVDIQHVKFPDHYHRFLHYHCAAIIQQAASFKHYLSNMCVFTIVVLTSGDRHKVDIARIDFDPKDRYGKGLNAIRHQVLYLCPAHVSTDTPEPYRQWLLAIQDSLDGEVEESLYSNPIIQELWQIIKQDGISPEELARLKDEHSYEELNREKYNEGFTEGMQTAALAMLQKGMNKTLVQEITGLSDKALAELFN